MAAPMKILTQTPVEALLRVFRKHNLAVDSAYMRDAMQLLVQGLMEIEVSQIIDASRYERNTSRRVYRNGYRERLWKTIHGNILLRIPRLRKGTYYPHFFDALLQQEGFLSTLAFEGLVLGANTQFLERLLNATGLALVPAYQRTALFEAWDELIQGYRIAYLRQAYSNVLLEKLTFDLEEHGRIVKRTFVIVIGVREDGERSYITHELVAEADEGFWFGYIRRLQAQGLDADYALVDAYARLPMTVDRQIELPDTDRKPLPIISIRFEHSSQLAA